MEMKRKGGGQPGNTNNLKWTPEETQKHINDISNYVLENDDCRSITLACVKCGTYEDILTYFREKFTNGEVDFLPIKRAMSVIKARLMEQGLENNVNSTMAIFILKNNHGMADKVEQKTEVKLEETVTIFELPNNNR